MATLNTIKKQGMGSGGSGGGEGKEAVHGQKVPTLKTTTTTKVSSFSAKRNSIFPYTQGLCSPEWHHILRNSAYFWEHSRSRLSSKTGFTINYNVT